MLQGTGETRQRSKRLRQEMSPPEIALWFALRGRPDGLKFRKQHPSGPYTADFYCHAARMIVEVDSEAHSRGDRPARDAARDRWFEARGITTLRAAASEIMRDCDAVVRGIAALAAERIADQE
jgi:very-short-patch-repair endonuclease